jgi:Polyketide cyclase / dehydrase and lipid transport
MHRAYFSTILDAPVAVAWSVAGDFHQIGKWVTRIRDSRAEHGSGPGSPGSVRRLILEPDGREVGECLVHYDEGARLYSYEFVDPNPYPVRSYRGTLHLLPVTQTNQTFIEWYGDFDADADVAGELSDSFVGIYTEFAGDLANYLTSRRKIEFLV